MKYFYIPILVSVFAASSMTLVFAQDGAGKIRIIEEEKPSRKYVSPDAMDNLEVLELANIRDGLRSHEERIEVLESEIKTLRSVLQSIIEKQMASDTR